VNPGTKIEVNGEEATLADIRIGDEVMVQGLEALFVCATREGVV
jgi:hypothetical protein